MYPSSVICLFLVNRPTKASIILLLPVTPDAQRSPLKQYEETFEAHTPFPSEHDAPNVGPPLWNEFFQNLIRLIILGTFSICNRPVNSGSFSANRLLHNSREGPQTLPNPGKLFPQTPELFNKL
jgi:hypothetical protein